MLRKYYYRILLCIILDLLTSWFLVSRIQQSGFLDIFMLILIITIIGIAILYVLFKSIMTLVKFNAVKQSLFGLKEFTRAQAKQIVDAKIIWDEVAPDGESHFIVIFYDASRYIFSCKVLLKTDEVMESIDKIGSLKLSDIK